MFGPMLVELVAESLPRLNLDALHFVGRLVGKHEVAAPRPALRQPTLGSSPNPIYSVC